MTDRRGKSQRSTRPSSAARVPISVPEFSGGYQSFYNAETGKHEALDPDRVFKKYSPKGRKLRKDNERPRPDLPSDAPVNRTRKQIALTLPPELIEALNAEVKRLGVDRNSFIEQAIRSFLGRK